MENSGGQVIFNQYAGDDASFEMPEDVTVIADRAFAGNKSLKHADLRNVRKIGDCAFQECTNLETVVMSKAAVIGQGAFGFCRSLRSVVFGDVEEIGDKAFAFCGALDIPRLPETLVRAGAGAFSHTDIRRADLHWLREIPPYLFHCCTSLRSADISGAEVIGESSFADCKALTHVRMDRAERIETKAFYKCASFRPADLPARLRYIGDNAFECVREGMTVPKGITHIGKNCFGPKDDRKSISIYRSSLYRLRNYFIYGAELLPEDDEHFYLSESATDVAVLDDDTGAAAGFLPLFSDLYPSMREALLEAFRPDNTFDYSVLDTVFMKEMRWNQTGLDRLAVMRLRHPFELTEAARAAYTDYLKRHAERIAKRAVGNKDIETLSFLGDGGFLSEGHISGLTDLSIAKAASECTAYLLRKRSESGRFRKILIDEL